MRLIIPFVILLTISNSAGSEPMPNAEQAQMDKIFAEMTPEDKALLLKQIQKYNPGDIDALLRSAGVYEVNKALPRVLEKSQGIPIRRVDTGIVDSTLALDPIQAKTEIRKRRDALGALAEQIASIATELKRASDKASVDANSLNSNEYPNLTFEDKRRLIAAAAEGAVLGDILKNETRMKAFTQAYRQVYGSALRLEPIRSTGDTIMFRNLMEETKTNLKNQSIQLDVATEQVDKRKDIPIERTKEIAPLEVRARSLGVEKNKVIVLALEKLNSLAKTDQRKDYETLLQDINRLVSSLEGSCPNGVLVPHAGHQ